MMHITTEQAIQVLLDNGMHLTIESGGVSDFLSSIISTFLGVIFGGIVTIIINNLNQINMIYKEIEMKLLELQEEIDVSKKEIEDEFGYHIGVVKRLEGMRKDLKNLIEKNKVELKDIQSEFDEIFKNIQENINILEVPINIFTKQDFYKELDRLDTSVLNLREKIQSIRSNPIKLLIQKKYRRVTSSRKKIVVKARKKRMLILCEKVIRKIRKKNPK